MGGTGSRNYLLAKRKGLKKRVAFPLAVPGILRVAAVKQKDKVGATIRERNAACVRTMF